MKWWLVVLLATGCDQLFGFAEVTDAIDAAGSGSSGGSADAHVDPGGWASLEPGTDHVCGVDGGGKLACFTVTVPGTFVPMPFGPSDLFWAHLSTGHDHTCGITNLGVLYCWGGNTYGEINGSMSSVPLNAPTETGPLGQTWLRVAAGGYHTCALTTANHLYCWGNNQQTGGPMSSPFHALTGTFTTLSAGVDHTCALDAAGNVFCWGGDGNGQTSGACATGSCLAVATPVQVPNITATAVSAGAFATCAIASGSVWCWGSNQRFNPGTSGNAIPTLVQGGGDWTDVAVGDLATCGIHSGRLACWGTEQNGGIGDGNGTALIAPNQAAELGPADHVSLTRARDGSELACAISAGSATCWGPPPRPAAVPAPPGA